MSGRRPAPGWREVLILAAALLAVVFAAELLATEVPAVHDLFSSTPATIVVLLAGTLVVLGSALLGSRRRG